ncbi:MAG: 3-phosphoshikimate 1-carboxyvinyltransferase [Proteobacteria bacterium]|nr:3-phosphoshikimate 1-carboxyvinyltransferase [Pseudomonadota bacterium]
MSHASRPGVPSYRVAAGGCVRGEVVVPGDKSVSHRAVLLGAIAEGTTEVEGFLESEDCLATLNAMRAMGVAVERPSPGRVVVDGVGLRGLRAPAAPLDMGNAGTAMRLSMGLLAGQSFGATLTGDESLSRRPMERAAAPLRLMGARIDTTEGHPPVVVHGGATLRGIDYELRVPSAQVKSAILLAGLYAEGRTTVTEHAVTRDHTERMLRAFGVPVESRAGRVSLEGGARLAATHLRVPGDISSAAFFLVAGAIAGEGPFLVRDVGMNPTRTGVLEILRLMGADLRILNPRTAGDEPVADIEVHARELRGIEVPRELVPLAIDEFPVLFVAAACARGTTIVTGAEELRVKESDRIATMAAGLRALGVEATPLADGMRITGGRLGGGRVQSHGDHRIAMAFAVAALRAHDELLIEDVANVATSFPGFAALARGAGLAIDEVR